MPRLLLVIGLGLCVRILAAADGELPQAPHPRVIPIAELVKQLGSEDFNEREAATKRLSAMALDPPPELLAAMKSDNQEVRDRATKAAQAMRSNLVATRLPRGLQFAERGHVDLYVAATTVWNLKPDDPRLWEPAEDLGRRLIEKAEMSRKPQCPSSFKDFATYNRQYRNVHAGERRVFPPRPQVPYSTNEAIQAAGVADPRA